MIGVVSRCGAGKDLVRRVALVVELGGCPFAQQRQILSFIVSRLPRFFRGALDATGNGAELSREGIGRQTLNSRRWRYGNDPG
jgi:phage FluMu gp28-like protein